MAHVTQSMGPGDAVRERRWQRIQAASGLVFAAFVLVHLVNQWLAVLGPEVYDGFQAGARRFYQHPALEPTLVLLPLVVHVVAALRRMRLAGVFGRSRTLRMRLHRATGYFLLLVIFGHIAAVRGPSVMLDFFPGFAGVSFSLWWMPAAFYPYYALFGASALYHGLNGTGLALHALGLRRDASLPSLPGGRTALLAPVLAGALLLVLALLAFGGRLFPIPDPRDNDYARMWERYGVDLGTR
jgi:succinate dehydrogenase/fumarate reductase cytochrome b subunit